MIYLDLLIGFLEVGFFSFGGAYAAIPLIRDVVMAHGWQDARGCRIEYECAKNYDIPILLNLKYLPF